MARPATIYCAPDVWTQLTEDEAGTVFTMAVISGAGKILATATGTAPTAGSTDGLPMQTGEGFSAKALTDLFHGVASPVRLYFLAERGTGAHVYIDHD